MFYLRQLFHKHRSYNAIFIAVFLSFFALSGLATEPLKTIAITQIVGHASLDRVRQGVIDELAKQGYQDPHTARLVFENAQGSLVLATQIAQQYVALRPDIIIAIATPSAQAVTNADKKADIPVVFASITDPIEARLVPRLIHPGGHITGTRNVSPINRQLALIKTLFPQAQTIGIVLNLGEANSAKLLDTVIQEAKPFHLTVRYASATNAGEVQTAASSLIGKIDALLLIQDNTVASALPIILKLSKAHDLPVFATYLDAVKSGALAGIACDEYAIGQQTADIAVQILKGKNPGDINVEDPKHIEIGINLNTAKALHLAIPQQLLQSATELYPEKGAAS